MTMDSATTLKPLTFFSTLTEQRPGRFVCSGEERQFEAGTRLLQVEEGVGRYLFMTETQPPWWRWAGLDEVKRETPEDSTKPC